MGHVHVHPLPPQSWLIHHQAFVCREWTCLADVGVHHRHRLRELPAEARTVRLLESPPPPRGRTLTHSGVSGRARGPASVRTSGSEYRLLCRGVSVKILIIHHSASELWSHESFVQAVNWMSLVYFCVVIPPPTHTHTPPPHQRLASGVITLREQKRRVTSVSAPPKAPFTRRDDTSR